jgi:hypothetical protein
VDGFDDGDPRHDARVGIRRRSPEGGPVGLIQRRPELGQVDCLDPNAPEGGIRPGKRSEPFGRPGDVDGRPELCQVRSLDNRGPAASGSSVNIKPVYVTVRVAVFELPAASRAVTVSTFDSDRCPPRLFTPVTWVTPTLSEAVPPSVIGVVLVLKVRAVRFWKSPLTIPTDIRVYNELHHIARSRRP